MPQLPAPPACATALHTVDVAVRVFNEESRGLAFVRALPATTHQHPSLFALPGSPRPSFVPKA